MLLNHIAAGFCWVDPQQPDRNHETRLASYGFHRRRVTPPSAAFQGVRMEKNGRQRRSICTADELHRVVVSNSDWKLALWRYLPSPEVPLFSSSQIFAFCEYPFGNALMYNFRVLNSLVFIEKHGTKAQCYAFWHFTLVSQHSKVLVLKDISFCMCFAGTVEESPAFVVVRGCYQCNWL